MDNLDAVLSPSVNDTNPLHFDLFVKTRRFNELQKSLQQVLELSLPQRRRWVREHQAFLAELMDNVVESATETLDGVQIDQDGLQPTVGFVSVMRDTMDMVRVILHSVETPGT